MKKTVQMQWIMAAALSLRAEVVITSPTGLPDEGDVAVKSTAQTVKAIPSDTVQVLGDAVVYTGDELLNTVEIVKKYFAGNDERQNARDGMLQAVDKAWGDSGKIEFCSYKISPAVGAEMAPGDHAAGSVVDVSPFFQGVDFPEGASAVFRPDYKRLLVRNTQANLLKVEGVLAKYHHSERSYKQVNIEAKFIEVSQNTLNQMGFTWNLNDTASDGVKIAGDWVLNDNQSVLGAGLRTAGAVFSGASAGTLTLTKDGWMPLNLVISALEQATDSDVLSAPSLTTVDGKAAEIWVGEDRQVPSSFEAKSADVSVHVEHKGWTSKLIGVNFKVTPSILSPELIKLTLNPKVIDLVGYDTYQVSPDNTTMLMVNGGFIQQSAMEGTYPILNAPAAGISKAWNLMTATLGADPNANATWGVGSNGPYPSFGYNDSFRRSLHEELGVPLASVHGSLPYFRVREIQTQVAVADGSTVGLGGLIYDRLETYKDKVPVLGSIPLLGRLFRSEGERSIKRNLMIFVEATQLDANGTHKADLAKTTIR